MGTIYRAIHNDLRVPFAVKVLAPDLARDAVAEERFYREAVAASHVRHPHVVRVSDYGRDRGITYFVMDYLEGEDLADLVARTALSVEQIANIMLPICSAICETHAKRFIHRDLKPSNIFLARDAVGRVVPTLLDFGVAKELDLTPSAALTRDGAIVGTPRYLAPELLRRLPATASSDQYALGVILYQCATGRLPFDGPTGKVVMAIMAGDFRHPRALRPDLPHEFVRLILRAMTERPSDRFESVRALGAALLAHASARHQAEWSAYFGGSGPVGSVTMAVAVDQPLGWPARANRQRTLEETASLQTSTFRRRVPRAASLAVVSVGLACAAGAAAWALSRRPSIASAKVESRAPLTGEAPVKAQPAPPVAASGDSPGRDSPRPAGGGTDRSPAVEIPASNTHGTRETRHPVRSSDQRAVEIDLPAVDDPLEKTAHHAEQPEQPRPATEYPSVEP
jgi:serine/threonine-protein kinase